MKADVQIMFIENSLNFHRFSAHTPLTWVCPEVKLSLAWFWCQSYKFLWLNHYQQSASNVRLLSLPKQIGIASGKSSLGRMRQYFPVHFDECLLSTDHWEDRQLYVAPQIRRKQLELSTLIWVLGWTEFLRCQCK
jgi:hypothetical protein